MIKVITYGTYDLLHYGHIRLLERAKALGDYLIVGVTAEDFDKARGKINVQQSLMERIEAVKATGLADEVIIEEYEGQKIDDIRRYGVDIFAVGSDWKGKFDYLKEYCEVIYLDRTEGISSSELRTQKWELSLGLVGEPADLQKFVHESQFVNGIRIVGSCTGSEKEDAEFEELSQRADALYILSHPSRHYEQVKAALLRGKHVLCEAPVAMTVSETRELFALAKKQKCVLMEAVKTAYSMAYSRLLLLAKSGRIGKVVSVDVTCTRLNRESAKDKEQLNTAWNSVCDWGPTALLPVFQLLGVQYREKVMTAHFSEDNPTYDLFSSVHFIYPEAVASVKVGKGVKSEGELVISGTEGYIYVPAPWWKTDYFEIRYENPADNKRYFYQLDGEGIRYEIVAFLKSIERGSDHSCIAQEVSEAISRIMEDFSDKKDVREI